MPDSSILGFILYNSVFSYACKNDLEDLEMKQNGYLQSILETWVKLVLDIFCKMNC